MKKNNIMHITGNYRHITTIYLNKLLKEITKDAIDELKSIAYEICVGKV